MRYCSLLLCLVACWAGHAQTVPSFSNSSLVLAQAPPISIRSTLPMERRIPIAVPDFGAPPGKESLGAEMAQVVRHDLDFTGLFMVVSKQSFPPSFTGFTSDPTQINFEPWRNTKVDFLVYAYCVAENNTLSAQCRLFDVLGGQQLVGTQLEVAQEWSRLLPHRFSDEIVRMVTGTPGVATSQICFSVGETGKKEIYIADYDGANAKQVTQHGSISILPKFSPDGRRIAYQSYKDRYPFLYILELDTGKSRPLSKSVGLNTSPAWSPDGTKLAVVLSKDANEEIYLMDADGSGKKRLTNDKALDTSPAFHPNGQEIVFVSERSGNPQVFAMSIDGSNVRRLSYQGGRSYDPVWSPDGRRIAYVVEKGGEGFQIYVMDADGKNARPLTGSGGTNECPSWSPDSRHVLFASTRAGGSQLWTVNADTGEERRVPFLNLRCQGPDWGPRR